MVAAKLLSASGSLSCPYVDKNFIKFLSAKNKKFREYYAHRLIEEGAVFPMFFSIIIPFLMSFSLVYLLTPLTKKMALYIHLVDLPGGRKIHEKPIPLSGGLAVYFGISLTLLFFNPYDSMTFILLTGSFFLMVMGLVDDLYKARGKDFSPWPKLLVQFIIAFFVYYHGFRFFGITNPFEADGFLLFPEWISFLFTVLWVMGFINMFNFIDGVDGLAGGISTISSLTLFFVAFLRGETEILIPLLALIGASLAFLRFNFYPAKVFLGDMGSMVIGYMLAVISLSGVMKGATMLTIMIALLALGFPVMDLIQVIVRRMREGRPIYKADRGHLHHQLMAIGLTQRQTVSVIYVISILFSLMALVLLAWAKI